VQQRPHREAGDVLITSPVAAVAMRSWRQSVPALNRVHSTRSVFLSSCAIRMMRRRRMFR